MSKKKSDHEIFMEMVFRAGPLDCQSMIDTLKAKIRSIQPKKDRKPRVVKADPAA